MGLDGVEIVISCEEEFGVELTDFEVETFLTPRDMIECIWRKIRGRETGDSTACRTQAAFYRLRRVIVNAWDVPRTSVKPDSAVAGLLGNRKPADAWRKLGLELGREVRPYLVAPKWPGRVLICGGLGVYVLGMWWLGEWVGFSPYGVSILPGFFVCLLLVFAGAYWLENKLRCILPGPLKVSDLLLSVPDRTGPPWTRELVANEVKRIVIETLGTDQRLYHEDAEFVRDLGLS